MKPLLILLAFLTTPLAARFESRPVHPLAINSTGTRLYATNAAEGRLSVFAIGPVEHVNPLLIAEVPIGLSPVSVRLVDDTEAWVVCELSDAIVIVDLETNAVTATIATGDEPGDVAFAGEKAYLTCSRDNSVEVFSIATRAKLETIPLAGLMPRAITASPDGAAIHVAFLHSGNGTTILPKNEAPPQPAPTDPTLPAPPQVGLIVPAGDARIPYTVVNHDLARIAVSDSSVTYTGDVGTNLFALHALPDGELLVPNSEARNLIRFEPELNGRFVRSRLGRFDPTTRNLVTVPLDTDPDTIPIQDAQAAATALAQTMAVTSAGGTAYLAAFGSDRVGVLNLADNSLAPPIDLRAPDDPTAPRGPLTVRGPRGLALHPALPRLYCFNKLSHTLSVIATDSREVIGEVSLSSFTDLAPEMKLGRGFLSDARLSGNGSVSCASCHIDNERDGLAWDLGDPAGRMQTVSGALNSLHAYTTFVDYQLHPMKGPMVTQTLIGLHEQGKLHWRGDRASIQAFNATFANLLGGSAIAPEDMDKVAAYLLTLRHHPNPHLNLDRTLPATLDGGNPAAGIPVYILFDNHCSECHRFPSGSSNNIDIPSTVGSFQALKDPPFRTSYQRAVFDNTPGGTSLSGFGLLSDGSGSLTELPIVHPYSLHILDDVNRPLATRQKEKRDLTAFLMAFDSGTAPAVGHSVALTSASTTGTPERQELAVLEAQSSGVAPGAGLVLRGLFEGQRRSFVYQPATATYRSSHSPELVNAATLVTRMRPDDLLLASGVFPGEEARFSIDRDRDNVPDPGAAPLLEITGRQFHWPHSPGWFLESSRESGEWQPETSPFQFSNNDNHLVPTGDDRVVLGRLRRTW